MYRSLTPALLLAAAGLVASIPLIEKRAGVTDGELPSRYCSTQVQS